MRLGLLWHLRYLHTNPYRYLLFGNRALTRVAWPQLAPWQGGLWGRRDIAPAVFLLEAIMAYLPYRLWLSALKLVDDSATTKRAIRNHKLAFWAIALCWNMPCVYLLQPLMLLPAPSLTCCRHEHSIASLSSQLDVLPQFAYVLPSLASRSESDPH